MALIPKKASGLAWVSGVLAIIFVLSGSLFPAKMNEVLQQVLNFITAYFGWMYLLVVLGFVGTCLALAFSRYGEIKLGKAEDLPDYSVRSWFAMLFSAGMGIGLVFWSVGEPLTHFINPPMGNPGGEAAVTAMRYTFFHWGVHPWAVYGVVGLSLAYFGFRKGEPLLISSTLKPILGARTSGWQGMTIDGMAVLASIFGVATSLGLGTLQINSGLTHLFGIPNNTTVSIAIIAVITILFTWSAFSGLDRGIKILSNLNMILVVMLLLFMFAVGPTSFILNLTTASLGEYLQNFLSMSLATEPVKQTGWVNGWTIFYWAWWIAWAPFVGGFIARISKGRTIKEFILGVLVAPVIFSFIWMGTFGSAALHLELGAEAGVAALVLKDIASGLFVVLEHYPLSNISSGLALVLIASFFITSADSASFVIGMLLSKGSLEPSAKTKVFWGVIQGVIAIILLLTGGLAALQTASIIAAFPFMLIMVLMCYALISQLRQDNH